MTEKCNHHVQLEDVIKGLSQAVRDLSDWRIADEIKQCQAEDVSKNIQKELYEIKDYLHELKLLLSEKYVTRDTFEKYTARQDKNIKEI